MSDGLNEGVVGDTAKRMAHRLIVRLLRRDPSLVERAKVAHARQAEQFAGWPFVREWQELLALPAEELASKLISRDREMVRLRNTSPFYLAEGVDLGDYNRVRLRRAARRILKTRLGRLKHPRSSLGRFAGRHSDRAHPQRAPCPDEVLGVLLEFGATHGGEIAADRVFPVLQPRLTAVPAIESSLRGRLQRAIHPLASSRVVQRIVVANGTDIALPVGGRIALDEFHGPPAGRTRLPDRVLHRHVEIILPPAA